ncbi:dipeptide/oligopeptide/nickel ABC transporter permease/ATP-binding protein [Microbacterium album]|uniref:Peptide ABC transporter ATP-binding protein n=1 Tax=Microbacterium album TaxID=2053191 RepID=A0A917ICX1_9MICO|nr:dipeptide/oligopeptide/nickel ABC transporter permease/ATP-binding protein [Microbacterium album]GGH33361.1 peptide ABC transporter ATP-binding protein [Microbacterium album]
MTVRRPSFFRQPMAIITLAMLTVLLFFAVFAPLWWGEQAVAADPAAINLSPSAEHPLGTDSLGRDILIRTLVATRLSLVMAFAATALGAICGLLIGALPSVLGTRAQRLFSSVISTWLAFPVLLVAMLTVILLGPGTDTAVIALALTMTPSFARLAQTLSARVGGSEYLAAARMLGVSRGRQFTHYVLPNIAEPVVVNITTSIGGALLALSSLSFLGIGVQPPQFDWGRMLSEGFTQVYISPIAAIGPGVAVVFAGLTFSMLGESLAAHMRRRSGQHTVSARKLGPAPRAHVDTAAATPAAAAGGPEPAAAWPAPLLDVQGLNVSFPSENGWVRTVQDVTFQIAPGELVGVVGESGSGKSVTMMSIAQLAPAGAAVTASRLAFEGDDLAGMPAAKAGKILGTRVGVVFQDSLTALNPALRVGTQLAEVPRVQGKKSRREAQEVTVKALQDVDIPDAERRAQQFPHEFSGGMRQRALIAMSQVGSPSLIIADEPTTALDVTVQRRVLTLLRRECAENGSAAIVVSHDIAVLAELCQRILVMYAGRIVEDIDVRLLATPEKLAHPYTRALAASLPDLDTDRAEPLATIPGEPPDLSQSIQGCAFAARCVFATEKCRFEEPPLASHAHGGRVACWHPQDGRPFTLTARGVEATRRGIDETSEVMV